MSDCPVVGIDCTVLRSGCWVRSARRGGFWSRIIFEMAVDGNKGSVFMTSGLISVVEVLRIFGE